MLQVGIHHGDEMRLACQHPLDAGARKATPPDAADATYPAVGLADRPRDRRSAVRGVVVDEYYLPIDALKRVRELLHQ